MWQVVWSNWVMIWVDEQAHTAKIYTTEQAGCTCNQAGSWWWQLGFTWRKFLTKLILKFSLSEMFNVFWSSFEFGKLSLLCNVRYFQCNAFFSWEVFLLYSFRISRNDHSFYISNLPITRRRKVTSRWTGNSTILTESGTKKPLKLMI